MVATSSASPSSFQAGSIEARRPAKLGTVELRLAEVEWITAGGMQPSLARETSRMRKIPPSNAVRVRIRNTNDSDPKWNHPRPPSALHHSPSPRKSTSTCASTSAVRLISMFGLRPKLPVNDEERLWVDEGFRRLSRML